MTRNLRNLLLRAVKQSGSYNPDDALSFIEEEMTLEEIRTATDFLSWVHQKELTFGNGNIEKVYEQFKSYK